MEPPKSAAELVMYTKPGCLGAQRQLELLQRAGVSVQVRDLAGSALSAAALHPFLQGLPVDQWFHPTAQAIRDGHVDPSALDAEEALSLLSSDPALIRRPLVALADQRFCGFDPDVLEQQLGLPPGSLHLPDGDDPERCVDPRGRSCRL